jgi:hypothetical protein
MPFAPSLDKSWEFSAVIDEQGEQIEATLIRKADGVWDAVFSAPETLDGTRMTVKSGEVAMSRGDVAVTLPANIEGVILKAFTAFDKAARGETNAVKPGKEDIIYIGDGYTLTAERGTGVPIKLTLDRAVIDYKSAKVYTYDEPAETNVQPTDVTF